MYSTQDAAAHFKNSPHLNLDVGLLVYLSARSVTCMLPMKKVAIETDRPCSGWTLITLATTVSPGVGGLGKPEEDKEWHMETGHVD